MQAAELRERRRGDVAPSARAMEGTMPTLARLREASRLYRRAAEDEATLEVKRLLASHAFALAQLAEAIERRQGIDDVVAIGNSSRCRHVMAWSLGAQQLTTIEPLRKEAPTPHADPGRWAASWTRSGS